MNPKEKYKTFPVIKMKNRQWPDKEIEKAPIWCSVDLRDGNQALPTPMTVKKKIEMFEMLVDCGFKEIEVGFPAASPTEYEFVRELIEKDMIPGDVTIQVLTQAREDLIAKTIESVRGAKSVIIHLYNSTSPAQREIVFGMEKSEIVDLAVKGTEWVKEYSNKLQDETEVIFQYSPESFSATEIEFSLEICEAVMNTWQPTPQNKMIINLPCTVEVAMPNVYADQIEWFCQNMNRRNASRRDSVIISVHTHNDRGTGVASTELAILAGADRVEGTLFGNGERTGNLDIVVVALNIYSHGIDPGLNFSNLEKIRRVYEKCTGMTVHERHPYSGELVFTAFSGSHQDAINKGLRNMNLKKSLTDIVPWNVPYLTIDPTDIGRKYDEVIRVNGQSGKGGIDYIMEQDLGICLPKEMLREFGRMAGDVIDALGREVNSEDIRTIFFNEYVNTDAYELKIFNALSKNGHCECDAIITKDGVKITLSGSGNGPIAAFVHAFNNTIDNSGDSSNLCPIKVLDQSEHALGKVKSENAEAISYVKLQSGDRVVWGAGIDTNIQKASIKAVISAIDRVYRLNTVRSIMNEL
jgi:2-isopropylmalate synthase